MDSRIKKLLSDKDNAELIRDQIAAILKLELLNQKEIADNTPDIDKKEFDIKVYLENSRPWALLGENGENNPFPLVNVCLQETTEDQKPGANNQTKYNGSFFIDCYGCGNYQPENSKDYVPDDFLSAIRAWNTARITRNILMSGFYTYLGMQGVVRRRRIAKITTVVPQGLQDSAVSITACRIIFEVEFHENNIEAQGIEFNGITCNVNNDGEVNLAAIMTDNEKESKPKE
jgi:hypothetical protein